MSRDDPVTVRLRFNMGDLIAHDVDPAELDLLIERAVSPAAPPLTLNAVERIDCDGFPG